MDRIFGESGLLSGAVEGFEVRPQQREMALAVWDALEARDVLLAEAGTGTGKTWAYLAPLILSGLGGIVSTGTKTLQDQILLKDVPILLGAMSKELDVVLLKGRRNYLCMRRLNLLRQKPLFSDMEEVKVFNDVRAWAEDTDTGEFSELSHLPEGLSLFSDLSSGQEACLGSKCEHGRNCFINRARRRAHAARLVIVNHHLFFADLALRAGGYGEVVPRHEAVVFDEAHSLESVVLNHLGVALSSHQIAELIRDVNRELTAHDALTGRLKERLSGVGSLATGFFSTFPKDAPRTALSEAASKEMDRHAAALADGLRKLATDLEDAGGSDWSDALAFRAGDLSDRLAQIMEEDTPARVRWFEARRGGVFLRTTPVDAAPFLRENLFSLPSAMIFTSATLTAGGDFSFFRSRMGLETGGTELALASPFDFSTQSLLYVPEDLPMPPSPDFLPRLARRIESLVEASRGRAFVLFTSYRNMLGAKELVGENLGYPLYVQGDLPRWALLDRFRRETDSVLFGTYTFWEGVDVVGESLSSVVIDKLPFASPADPVLAARLRMMEAEGRNPFFEYQVPAAIISLKQGLGRLLRSTGDRGLLAVLDVRLLKRGYGRLFLESLPDLPVTHLLEDVRDFFAKKGSHSAGPNRKEGPATRG